MEALKTIKGSDSKSSRRLLLTLVLACFLILNVCISLYLGYTGDLIIAAQRGDVSTVKALLAKGANVNAKNNNGVTALMMASGIRGHFDIAQALLSWPAPISCTTSQERATTHDIPNYATYK